MSEQQSSQGAHQRRRGLQPEPHAARRLPWPARQLHKARGSQEAPVRAAEAAEGASGTGAAAAGGPPAAGTRGRARLQAARGFDALEASLQAVSSGQSARTALEESADEPALPTLAAERAAPAVVCCC